MTKLKEITRHVKPDTERELWARSAGRCEFKSCNRLLIKSPVTQESVNIADKAHIYSFSEKGPRGWGFFRYALRKINDSSNLLLVCHDCHKNIDKANGADYLAELLQKWKAEHENRIRTVTGISPDRKSNVIFYCARIGEQDSPLDFNLCATAMFGMERFPEDDRPILLSTKYEHEDNQTNYWKIEADHLRASYDKQIGRITNNGRDHKHFSLFGFAPQPLLILFGILFTDIADVDVYQLHREPRTWEWLDKPDNEKFIISEPDNFNYSPVLVISLSDKICHERITAVIGSNISIWELSINDCNNDFLKSEAQLSEFRKIMRKLMVSIKTKHGQGTPLSIFPAMPLACAIELGRIRMPKAEMPWIIYDQNNKEKKFIKALNIPEV